MNIIIVSGKENFSEIKKILKGLMPDIAFDFVGPENIKKINKIEGGQTHLFFNYDNLELREACRELEIKKISFGFSEGADFMASDVNETENGINFKLNYKGNSVPIWIKKNLSKNEIYDILAIISAAITLGLNIIEISEKLN